MTEERPSNHSLLPSSGLQPGSPPDSWSDGSDAEMPYSRLSILALTAFCVSLLSLLVFLTGWLAFLPFLAILLACVALRSIHRAEGALFGRALGQTALSLSIIAIVSFSVWRPLYQSGIRHEADQFFRIWFQTIQDGNVPLGLEMQHYYYWGRGNHHLAEEWWPFQYNDEFRHADLRSFLDNKIVRLLLALGEKADIRFYKTLSQTTQPSKNEVQSIYSVTYEDEAGAKKTFFVKMVGEKAYPEGAFRAAGWRLTPYPAFFVPEEF